ncbi:MAG: pentapeptide repeat-containing protein [Acidobacteria bacterium]|nr:pentapeptide repeat-containing protein [Acidobacteriota bacterium]
MTADGINLNGASLDGLLFEKSSLQKASLKGAHIQGCSFWGVRMPECCLVESQIWLSNFVFAEMDRADLRGASLFSNFFNGALMKEADFGTVEPYSVFWDNPRTDGSVIVSGNDFVGAEGVRQEVIGIDGPITLGRRTPGRMVQTLKE